MSGEWIDLCPAADVPDGGMIRIVPPGRDAVAVTRVDGAVFVFDDLCTHGMASLSEGDIEDGQVFCPFHGGSFDIRTGKPGERPCTIPIRTYSARVEGGIVQAVMTPG